MARYEAMVFNKRMEDEPGENMSEKRSAHSRARAQFNAPKPSRIDGGKANVLLVDDHAANLLALEAMLAPLGQPLIRANSGREALDFLEHDDAAVILMDVRMPGMDGFRTMEELRRREGSSLIPIIFLTAFSGDAAEVMRAYGGGAVDFILKPFDLDIVRSKVSVFINLYLKEQTIKRQAALLLQREREAFEQRSEVRFRTLIDAMPLCVVVADHNGAPYYWNKQALDYTGVSPREATLREGLLNTMPPEDRERFERTWNLSILEERPFETKFRIRRNSDGAYRWHLGRGIPQFGDSGRGTGWILTATDIESEAQALIQAEAASRLKDEFLATVSHELRTPLNAIVGWVHLLRNGSMGPEKSARALETIERNVHIQASLIEDLLDLSRIVKGKMQLTFKPLDLTGVVEAALSTIGPSADAKQLEIVARLGDPRLLINGDQDRLAQVVSNILSNSIRFTPPGGRIEIHLEAQNRQALLTISDTGKGISPEFLPFVFDPFKQADSSTTRENTGLGLGLAIARNLVQLHEGSLTIASPGLGQGASVSMVLPLHRTESEEPDIPGNLAGHSESLAGIKILLVEDDVD
ncbi:MAG: hybrid sensor histidine kinase/response regulator [Candidatus Binataceae bacterium]